MAQRLEIDAAKSVIGFSVKHLMFSRVRGRFTRFTGALELDDDFARSRANARIDTASLDTKDGVRDAVVRGQLLDAPRFPELAFESTALRGTLDAFTLTGSLALHGVAREVSLSCQRTGGEPLRIRASCTLARKSFGLELPAGLDTGGMLMGENVEVELDLVFVNAR